MRSLVLAALLAVPAGAQAPAGVPQPGLVNLSLLEALVAVERQDLSGVFGYVPDQAATSAFADYLFRDRGALKKFIKKARRDRKETNGINEWDREVFMVMTQINAQPLPPDVAKLSKKEELAVTELVLVQPLSLGQLNALRKR